ncbi:MAG: GPP34 family phosphoprotein [Mycobacteriaceae bacterium]|nr:GPP34 family phosphoprotein [Mycobacteriaceae bacterium]
MARIAEDLLLLLLDNPAAQPGLGRRRRGSALAAALLLDLALGCRVRPALPGDPGPPGHLLALSGPVPLDPAVRPALGLLQRGPLRPAAAVARLRGRAEDDVLDQLLRTGQLHQVSLTAHRLRRNTYRWPLTDPARVGRVRAALAATLFEHRRPDPVTAALADLLGAVDGFPAVLALDAAGMRYANARAAEIASGQWADGPDTAARNLAVTAAAVLPALG